MELYSLKPKNFKLVNLRTIDLSERSDEGNMHMISSFNGLICCKNWVYENELWDLKIWICNPCTGETLLLPQGRPSFGFVPIVGVAYGSDISDYKVLRWKETS
ncbi:unnamed protein product [Arabis nemorensis]|uniref:F-box associated beta-propeller type 3 domain-containing protein n=1 Tax=Arabis nemorensis TaxID=586526 RepID=A0A565BBI1_9BRAS|nr:unnamed protein product [Arabis nemorensis]